MSSSKQKSTKELSDNDLTKAMKYYLDHRDKYINYMKIYNKYYYLLNRQNLKKTQKEKRKPVVYELSLRWDADSTTILFDD
jgi:hypothetical protein